LNKSKFLEGVRDGILIGLGYLTVSFSVGIACQNAGLSPLQGAFISLLNNASAGEYAGLTVIAADSGFLEIILMMVVANARYLLMSCALSQKFDPKTAMGHRLLIGFDITDELFGLGIAQEGYLVPSYYYGAMCSSVPMWCLGTVMGIILGNNMPAKLVSAFSVTLFGMFIAIIIPAAKKDRVVFGCVAAGFALSYLSHALPVFSFMSDGAQIIVLTVLISAAAAYFFPHKDEEAAE